MSPENQDLFDAAYVMPGVEGCRRLLELYDQGLHDFRERTAEKEMVHRAIVCLADKLDALAAQQVGAELHRLLGKAANEGLPTDYFLQKFDTKGGTPC